MYNTTEYDRNAYRTLGVPQDATEDEIRAAYRARAKATHPDRGGSAEEFRAVRDAYVDAVRVCRARFVREVPFSSFVSASPSFARSGMPGAPRPSRRPYNDTFRTQRATTFPPPTARQLRKGRRAAIISVVMRTALAYIFVCAAWSTGGPGELFHLVRDTPTTMWNTPFSPPTQTLNVGSLIAIGLTLCSFSALLVRQDNRYAATMFTVGRWWYMVVLFLSIWACLLYVVPA